MLRLCLLLKLQYSRLQPRRQAYELLDIREGELPPAVREDVLVLAQDLA